MSSITDDLTFVMQGPIIEDVTKRCLERPPIMLNH